MDFTPPISSRETSDLLGIVEDQKDWEKEAVAQAQKELETRGIGISKQNALAKSQRSRKKRVLFIKENARYSWKELLLIGLFGPLLNLLFGNFNIYTTKEGYKKKNVQGIFASLVGLLFWFCLIWFFVSL